MPISRVFMIVDRYESGYGHGWKQDGFDLSKTPHSDPELAEAYDLGYKAGHDARERAKAARPGVARMVRKWKQGKPAERTESDHAASWRHIQKGRAVRLGEGRPRANA